MNQKKVLTHLIRAGRDALHLEQTLNSIGYKETPYFNLYGEIADAIYCMLDEDTESFDESVTHAAIHDPLTSDELAAEELAKLLDKASDPCIDIPSATRKMIAECAEKRGVSETSMIKLILSEWAARELYTNNCL